MADDEKKMLVRCFPVDWNELKSATADEIELAKIPRCNAYFSYYYPGLNDAQKRWLSDAMRKAEKDPGLLQLPAGVEHPAKFPIE
jgi:hypothetical protein